MIRKISLLLLGALPLLSANAQNNNSREAEQIVITRKGNSDEKMNIIVDGSRVTVNGAPVSNDKDAPISVTRKKIKDIDVYNDDFTGAGGPNNRTVVRSFSFSPSMSPNKAMLGVTTNKTDNGVEVIEISENSAAAKAGLQQGDIITKIDGKAIESPDDLSKVIRDKNPGDVIKVAYTRDGKSNTTNATLTKWEARNSLPARDFGYGGTNNWQGNVSPNIDMDEIFKALPQAPAAPGHSYSFNMPYTFEYNSNAPKLGIKIQEADNEKGVKVLDVEEGTPAAKAGLKAGDIITAVDGTPVTATDAASRTINAAKRRGNIKMKINRNGSTQNIDVVIPKERKTADL